VSFCTAHELIISARRASQQGTRAVFRRLCASSNLDVKRQVAVSAGRFASIYFDAAGDWWWNRAHGNCKRM
jgi:hypothetical protein